MEKQFAKEEALFYEEMLKEEINEDREEHGKKPLKEKDHDDDNDNDNETPPDSSGGKEIKVSTTDPESGWLRIR